MSIIPQPFTGYPDWQRTVFDGPPLLAVSGVDPTSGTTYGPYYVGAWYCVTISTGFDGDDFTGGNPQFTWYADQALTQLLGQLTLYTEATYQTPWQSITLVNRGPWLSIQLTGTD